MNRPSAVFLGRLAGTAVLVLLAGLSGRAQDLRDVAFTSNQFQTADALERFWVNETTCTCDLSQSINYLHGLQAQGFARDARYGLDELSGQDLAGVFDPRQALSGMFTQRLAWQLRPAGPEPPRRLIEYCDAPGGGAVPAVGSPVGGSCDPCGSSCGPCGVRQAYLAKPRPAVWVQGFGGFGDASGGPGVYDSNLGGVLFGGHAAVTDEFALGAAGEYGHVSANATRTSLDVDSWRLLGYGRYVGETLYAFGGAGFGFDNYSTQRLVVLGPFDRIADASFDGHEVFGFGETGLTLPVSGTIALQPFVGFSANHLARDGFTEQGAGQLGLIAAGADRSLFSTYVGGRAVMQRYLGPELLLRPEVRAAWWHDFVGDGGSLNAAWVRDPTTTFAVGSAVPGRDATVLGTGVTLVSKGRHSIGAQYDAAIASQAVTHLFSVTALCSW